MNNKGKKFEKKIFVRVISKNSRSIWKNAGLRSAAPLVNLWRITSKAASSYSLLFSNPNLFRISSSPNLNFACGSSLFSSNIFQR